MDRLGAYHIQQIIPATSWVAIFKNDEAKEIEVDLVCFALAEKGGIQSMQALFFGNTGQTLMASAITGFVRFEKVKSTT